MSFSYVRLSFNIPIKDHLDLKSICDDEKIHLKEFMLKLIRREIRKRDKNPTVPE